MNPPHITKPKKNELNLVCEECGKSHEELDAAHRSGRSRRAIIKTVLDDYESEAGKYIIRNLRNVIKKIKEGHFPVEDNFRFLCKSCHKEYDDDVKKETNDSFNEIPHTENQESYQTVFANLLQTNNSLKSCLKELFRKFPNDKIYSRQLRKIYEKQYYPEKDSQKVTSGGKIWPGQGWRRQSPEKNSQKVTDYLWHLRKEGFLESTERSLYKLASKSNNK